MKTMSARVRVHRILFKFLLVFLLASTYEVSCQQDFISIDCGSVGKNYSDLVTNLTWESEDKYLGSKSDLEERNISFTTEVTLGNTSSQYVDNRDQLKTARVFLPVENAHPKYCYKIPVKFRSDFAYNYLVRAMFPSSNMKFSTDSRQSEAADRVLEDGKANRFYFTIDSTFISTIELHPHEPRTLEVIVNTLDRCLYACLVPLEDRSSMPAISSLELRELDPHMYGRGGNISSQASTDNMVSSTYLVSVCRLNLGINVRLPTIRYPEDKYDRLWHSSDSTISVSPGSVKDIKNTTVKSEFLGDANFVPEKVWLTAWEAVNESFSIEFNLSEIPRQSGIETFYFTVNFWDFERSEARKQQRVVNVKLDNENWDTARNITDTIWTIYNAHQKFKNSNPTFGFSKNSASSLPPLLNALEMLGEFEAVMQRTNIPDADAIIHFSNEGSPNFLDQDGDPCLPVPWSWLVCSIEVPPRVTQINVTGRGIEGNITSDLGNLDRLTILDLSHNNFFGHLPLSFAEISYLREVNIANNSLTGELPKFKPRSLQHLESLSCSHNQLSGSIDELIVALDLSIVNLNLSYNQLSGPIPSTFKSLTNLRTLDLSNNRFDGNFSVSLPDLTSLSELNVEDNQLASVVLDGIWNHTSLQVVNFNNNSINDALDLTTWYNNALQQDHVATSLRLVSFVNNNITTIGISVDKLDRIPRGKLENSPIILLGGNPWCFKTEKWAHKYLCRSREIDQISDSSSKEILVISLSVGAVIITLCCMCTIASLWRMCIRERKLRSIQEGLEKRKVHPPFYKYQLLKAATRGFHQEHKLGAGAFGNVYKAVLDNGTTLAVKVLNSSPNTLDDFFNEVVLINGIKHRNLIQLKGCCLRDEQRILVYEYAEGKNVAEALWGEKVEKILDWPQRFKICLGVARGLSYLHEELQPRIIHRDIKPENILLDKNLDAKIADFGLAWPIMEDKTQISNSYGGTLGYISPEYATNGVLTEKLDVYSYGILMLEIVAGRKCIDHSLQEKLVFLRNWAFELFKKEKLLELLQLELREMCSKEDLEEVIRVLKVALLCLQEDRTKRPTMSQVVIMLLGNAGVVVEIINELKSIPPMYEHLFEASSSNNTLLNFIESGKAPLLKHGQSSFSGSITNTRSNIELTAMLPR